MRRSPTTTISVKQTIRRRLRLRPTENSGIPLFNFLLVRPLYGNSPAYLSRGFYLERRLEHLADIFSGQNELYPLDGISLYFIDRPADWTEHRFTVDSARVMRLL